MFSIIEFVIGKYDPRQHCLQPPRQKARQDPGFVRVSEDNLSINIKTGNIEKYKENGQTSEWDVVTHRTTYGQRQATLTDADQDKIKEHGLKEDKASQLKPLWAAGYTIAECSGMKKEKGFSPRTVAKYHKAFQEAIGER
ncbi:MAG: hypothetical protein R2828_29710 [Saprospiraceae bacterium]